MKMIFFLAIALPLGLWQFFRWFEHKQIYAPSKYLQADPSSISTPFEEHWIPVNKNEKLHAWFIPTSKNNTAKVVLYCHGNAGNISDRIGFIPMFQSIGVDLLLFDYRGFGQSSGKPSEQNTYEDALAAYDFLRQEKGYTAEQIVIYGKSLGGAIGIELALKRPIHSIFINSTFTSIADIGKHFYPYLPVKLFGQIRYDNLSKIEHVSAPKFFMHSLGDTLIPLSMAQQLFDKAQEPKQTFFKHYGAHAEMLPESQQAFIEEAQVFLQEGRT